MSGTRLDSQTCSAETISNEASGSKAENETRKGVSAGALKINLTQNKVLLRLF